MNEIKLDKYQQKAVITNKNTLLVAGAGAGKTTTILGKINYLLENGYKEDEILCISFTNASTTDLKKKLNNNIDVFTFHKLAIQILNSASIEYTLCDDNLLILIIDLYIEQVFSSKKKKKKFLKYVPNPNNFKKLASRFIHLFKANQFDEYKFKDMFLKIKKIKKKRTRLVHFMNLINIINIYKLYKTTLKENNEFDFDDLIIEATKVVQTTTFTDSYKYIIIDEFQDTSQVRLNLILEIYHKNNCKVFCVGDDFQSIYQFTGCDLNLFLNFKTFFKDSTIKKLKMTYRNPQQLIHVAGNFIMKNKKQIKKVLLSSKSIAKPIKIVYLKKNNLFSLLNKINTEYMILGRNNKDIYDYFTQEQLQKHNIIYSTIHRSKGLEAENIILIHLTNDFDSIPSKIQNDYLIDLLLHHNKDIYYEERRLFYVALTRTKNNVYLVTQKNQESEFVLELIKEYKKYIEILYI